MPNWVYNNISFTFKTKKAAIEFKKLANNEKDGTHLDFAKLVPLTNPETGKPDPDFWDYDIAIKEWGVKWTPNCHKDPTFEKYGENEYTLFYTAQTPWDVPKSALGKIAKKYDCDIAESATEESNAFVYELSIKDGNVIEQTWDPLSLIEEAKDYAKENFGSSDEDFEDYGPYTDFGDGDLIDFVEMFPDKAATGHGTVDEFLEHENKLYEIQEKYLAEMKQKIDQQLNETNKEKEGRE